MSTILIVDDEEIIRRELCEYLSLRGYVVREANGRDEAIAVMKTEPIHAALIDYRMPGANGIDVLAYIKKEFPAVKVIFVTGEADNSVVEHALTNGAAAFFIKPVDGSAIADTLTTLLS
ncbi:MAG: response regulator [Spirochaetota bacterium]